MNASLLFSLFLIWKSFHFLSACSCFPESEQDKFCSAHFVARVEVRNSSFAWTKEGHKFRAYSVFTLEIFKGPRQGALSKARQMATLLTPPADSLCGVELPISRRFRLHNQYLVSGLLSPDEEAWIGLCGWNEMWRAIPKPTRLPLITGKMLQLCALRDRERGRNLISVEKDAVSKLPKEQLVDQ